MSDLTCVADALRAQVQTVNSHKSWHRAALHLIEATPNLDPACVMGLAGKLIIRKPKKRDRQLWNALLDAGDHAARKIVAEFVADVGPNNPGVEELRRYHPYFCGLVDQGTASTSNRRSR